MAHIVAKNLCKSYDGTYLAVNNINLEVVDKDFCVLLGPSGCGKTTLLRMIAGLEAITSGDLYINDEHMNNVLPKDRDIAMVFQSYALYPHMSVYKNMAFGLKMKKMEKASIDSRIRKAAKILDLDEYLERKPRNLSGGQQQRVALGRALVKDPRVFLMDEPLSNLDAKLRQQTRESIVKIHRSAGATTLYVTHDQVEAMTMATKIVVINKGVVQQIGTPDEIFTYPANVFVATFIGAPSINLLKGRYEDGKFKANAFELSLNPSQQKQLEGYNGKEILFGLRPEFISLKEEQTTNCVRGTVAFFEKLGAEVIIKLEVGEQTFQAKIHHKMDVEINDTMDVYFDTRLANIFDAETECAIALPDDQ